MELEQIKKEIKKEITQRKYRKDIERAEIEQ